MIAGLGQVPAIVRETDESERLELALIENMARQDLNAIEEARACATLVEDLGLTKEEVGRRVGRSRVAVSNLIRMLELPDEALAMVESGELSGGHGRALLLVKDQSQRLRLAREARGAGWSVRETERRAREVEDGPRRRREPGPDRDPPRPRGRARRRRGRALRGARPRGARAPARRRATASSSSSTTRARAWTWPSGCSAASRLSHTAPGAERVSRGRAVDRARTVEESVSSLESRAAATGRLAQSR